MTNTPTHVCAPGAQMHDQVDRELDLVFAVDDFTVILANVRKDSQATAVIAELPTEPVAATLHAAAVTVAEVARLRRQLDMLETAGKKLATAAMATLKG